MYLKKKKKIQIIYITMKTLGFVLIEEVALVIKYLIIFNQGPVV